MISQRHSSLFSHVIRLDGHTPAHQALKQAVAVRSGFCSFLTGMQQIGDATRLNGLRHMPTVIPASRSNEQLLSMHLIE